MSYKPRTFFQILEDISRNALFLPHIQRPFVWEDDQMIRLFDSLMRSYPVQTLLFWRTTEHIKARKFMPVIDRDLDLSILYDEAKSREGIEKTFVLDGQQRIKTLHAIFYGGIVATNNATAEAYFDVTGGATEINGGDLLYKLEFSDKPLQLPYYRIRNLLDVHSRKDAATIADDLNDQLEPILKEIPEIRRAR